MPTSSFLRRRASRSLAHRAVRNATPWSQLPSRSGSRMERAFRARTRNVAWKIEKTGIVQALVLTGSSRPVLGRLPAPQGATRPSQFAGSCEDFSHFAVTPEYPGLCSRKRRGESPLDARISSGSERRASATTPGNRPGSARASDPVVGQLLAAASGWPRRTGPAGGPGSASPAAPARSRPWCPAARRSQPLHATQSIIDPYLAITRPFAQ